MKTISLSQGLSATVDDSDYEWLSKFPWYAKKCPHGAFYAASNFYCKGRHRTIRMHTLIVSPLPGWKVDHKDKNTLNNRRLNLRECTPGQNMANAKLRKDNQVGFKGVYWSQRDGKWVVTIQSNTRTGRAEYLGIFDSAINAAKAYDAAAIEHFGQFALTNQALGLYATL